ncbi:hypothetical protein HYQ46_002188 [Verticillium longisporum]|nr:hypothetical protein HYQ46_002188 [Verticillium longisporum]
MAPAFIELLLQARNPESLPSNSAEALRQQWRQPSDVLSVLLLLGGEVVNKALGQLAGGRLTPVTFSFGWASYAMTTLLASVGDAKLMPGVADASCLVINANTGYVRNNGSWVIERLVRDYESWMHVSVKEKLNSIREERQRYMQKKAKVGTVIPKPYQTGLCIGVYEPSKRRVSGEPARDLLFWSGAVVAIIQMMIASSVPLLGQGDWFVLLITACGTILALATGSLPEWASEKWACRRGTTSGFILTRGNGAQHAILIMGNGNGLNLEDLAVSHRMHHRESDTATKMWLGTLSTLWIVLLISAAGLTNGSIYLLAVGGLGMLHSIVVVGWRRDLKVLGIHLEFLDVVGEMATMDALLRCEAKFPGAGRALLPIFFPGKLLPEEVLKWEALEAESRGQNIAGQGEAMEESREENDQVESWAAQARSYEKVEK